MINAELFVQNLNSYKDTETYSLKELAKFLNNNNITKDFYQKHVDKINKYIKESPIVIGKLSNDINYFKQKSQHCFDHYQYTQNELIIIKEILDKHLMTFYFLAKELNENFNILNCGTTILRLAYDVYDSDDTAISDLIDYIIKYCVIPFYQKTNDTVQIQNNKTNYILNYFEETDTFTLDSKEFKLTTQELFVLKEICKPANQQGIIKARDVNRINTKAREIIKQSLIDRKLKDKPYQFKKNIKYKD